MDANRLQELEELCAKATPGPWAIGKVRHYAIFASEYEPAIATVRHLEAGTEPETERDAANAAFIAAARTALPELVAEVKRLQAIIAKVPEEILAGWPVHYAEDE